MRQHGPTDETRRIVGWTLEEAKGRLLVIVRIITESTQSTIEQVAPARCVFRPDEYSMVRHLGTIAKKIGLPAINESVVSWSLARKVSYSTLRLG